MLALCLPHLFILSQSILKSLAHVYFNTADSQNSTSKKKRKNYYSLVHWKIVTVVAPFESIKLLNNVHIKCGIHLFLYLGRYYRVDKYVGEIFAPIQSSFEWVSSRCVGWEHLTQTYLNNYSVSVTHENPKAKFQITFDKILWKLFRILNCWDE